METVLGVAAFGALIGAWHWWQYKSTGGRVWSPLWGAFTFTAVSILFVVAGAVGYKITHGVPFTNPEEWTGQAIWSEIGVGLAAALLASFLWRLGLRSLETSPPSATHRRPL